MGGRVSGDGKKKTKERATHLRPPEHHSIQQKLHLLPSVLSLSADGTILLYRVQDLVLKRKRSKTSVRDVEKSKEKEESIRAHVPKADVLHLAVSALVAMPVILERPVEGLAWTELAEVVRVGCREKQIVNESGRRTREDDATHDLLR